MHLFPVVVLDLQSKLSEAEGRIETLTNGINKLKGDVAILVEARSPLDGRGGGGGGSRALPLGESGKVDVSPIGWDSGFRVCNVCMCARFCWC